MASQILHIKLSIYEASEDLLGDREVKIIALAASLESWFIRFLKRNHEEDQEDEEKKRGKI